MIDRFAGMPSALRAQARWERLGAEGIPALLAHPDWNRASPAPAVIWMHGRSVNKELDPGRYLRWLRAGIATCAVDLPGHGARFDPGLQEPSASLQVVKQMAGELDGIVAALGAMKVFDLERLGVGGMSAGGMAALVRLCASDPPHPFRGASVEATTGSWQHQRGREMFRGMSAAAIDELNPIKHLEGWREIPFQAIHAQGDEWVAIEGQREFIAALRARYADPALVELIEYERTGAPNEHAGFGTMAADAKDRQRDFFRRALMPPRGA